MAEGLQDQMNTEMCVAMTKVPTKLRVPLGVEGKWGYNFRDMNKFMR